MDRVDVLIIIGLVLAVRRGLKVGLLQLALSTGGFIVGLLAGSWLASQLAPHIDNPAAKVLSVIAVELCAALLLSTAGQILGLRLSLKARGWHLSRLNEAFGSVFEAAALLLVVWLVASGLANVRSWRVGYFIRHSAIVRALDRNLPPPPDFLARLEKVVSPNGFPNVFVGLEPQRTTVSPDNQVNNQLVLAAENSVVKIEGRGCGGIVEGSGFVAADGVVVTNAHVIAGVRRPEVIDRFGTHAALPVWFDTNRDLAVLKTDGLNEPPIKLSAENLPARSAAVTLGFPGGGPLIAGNAVVIDAINAQGHDIYNRGLVIRQIYELQTDVEPGNSGGPVIAPDGTVAGIVFAKSVSQGSVGYALTLSEVRASIEQAASQNNAVATGQCAS